MWTRPHNMIKGIEAGVQEDAPMNLPRGVDPVTKGTRQDLDRLKKEVAIICQVAPESRKYPWGREAFFRSKTGGMHPRRLLVAYSVDAARRIVRGWYLSEFDQHPQGWYRENESCPCEAAWLATIAPGKPSEPAWLYLRQPYRIEAEQPDGEWMLYSNDTWGTYADAMSVAKKLAAAEKGKLILRVVPHPDYS